MYRRHALPWGREDVPVELIDAEMTSWYGNRAVDGLYYLRDLAARLSGTARSQR